jgi:hypothetical protein
MLSHAAGEADDGTVGERVAAGKFPLEPGDEQKVLVS